jgi:hypothetical protein
MRKILIVALVPLSAFAASACEQPAPQAGATAQAASAEVPNPAMAAPDQTAWQLFAAAVAPAGEVSTFESWASDHDTFQPNATWPTGAAASDGLDLRPSLIPAVRRMGAAAADPDGPELIAAPAGLVAPTVDSGDGNQSVGAGSAPPTPAPDTEPGSVASEEVRRNKPAFDFIVSNKLNARSGLKAAFAANMVVNFPTDSIEVKTNWLPVDQVGKFYPGLSGPVEQNFYVANDTKGQPHALIAMHVISKQVPNWTWATFEHQANPGRCDFIGCRDTYGAATAWQPPANNGAANQGTVYANCGKTQAVQRLLSGANVAAVFGNYCLKGSQTDFIDNEGFAVRLANSVTEWSFVDEGSCMTCHGMANFGADGTPTTGGGFDPNPHVGAIDPTYYWSIGGVSPGQGTSVPIVDQPVEGQPPPGTRLAVSADFVWSIPFCAYDDTDPSSPKLKCVNK